MYGYERKRKFRKIAISPDISPGNSEDEYDNSGSEFKDDSDLSSLLDDDDDYYDDDDDDDEDMENNGNHLDDENDLPSTHLRRPLTFIEKIREGATHNRALIKSQLEELEPNFGTNARQKARERWTERFTEFQVSTLKTDPTETPSFEDLLGFMLIIPPLIRDSKPNQRTMSYRAFIDTFTLLSDGFFSRFPNWELCKHDEIRFQSLANNLLREGHITRDPSRELQWISAHEVKQMMEALVSDAICNGTKSWHNTVVKWLGVVLQAALGIRAGDFLRNVENRYLQYKDVDLRVEGTFEEPNFIMRVTIRNAKGYQARPDLNACYELTQLSDGWSVVDPIKILIILALRTGAVNEKTYSMLLRNALARPNKSVAWQHPDRPIIFCSFKIYRPSIFDSAAKPRQQMATLQYCADLLGILEHITPHDLRRGAAADVAAMPKSQTKGGVDAAQRILRHTDLTRDAAVTDAYVGADKSETWRARLDHASSSVFRLSRAAAPYEPANPSSNSISAECVRMGWNKRLKNDRIKAARRVHRRERAEWVTEEKRRLYTPINTLPHERSLQRSPLFAIFCDEEEDHLQPRSAEDVRPRSLPSILTCTTSEFIEFFSRINLVRIELFDTPQHLMDHKQYQTSTNEPSQFFYTCKTQGCGRQFSLARKRTEHEENCSEIRIAANLENSRFPCTVEECDFSFNTQEKLDAHTERLHEWKPKECARDSCEDSTVFQTRAAYMRHIEEHHTGWVPLLCNVPGCSSKRLWLTQHRFSEHLRKVHQSSKTNRNDNMSQVAESFRLRAPKGSSDEYVESMCLVPNCQSRRLFPGFTRYTTHLRLQHQLEGWLEWKEYIPTKFTARIPEVTNLAALDAGMRRAFEFPEEGQHCTFPDCDLTKTFTKRINYVSHLKKHKVQKGEYSYYMSGKEIFPFIAQTCKFPGCTLKPIKYESSKMYHRHLLTQHGVNGEECKNYYVLSIYRNEQEQQRKACQRPTEQAESVYEDSEMEED